MTDAGAPETGVGRASAASRRPAPLLSSESILLDGSPVPPPRPSETADVSPRSPPPAPLVSGTAGAGLDEGSGRDGSPSFEMMRQIAGVSGSLELSDLEDESPGTPAPLPRPRAASSFAVDHEAVAAAVSGPGPVVVHHGVAEEDVAPTVAGRSAPALMGHKSTETELTDATDATPLAPIFLQLPRLSQDSEGQTPGTTPRGPLAFSGSDDAVSALNADPAEERLPMPGFPGSAGVRAAMQPESPGGTAGGVGGATDLAGLSLEELEAQVKHLQVLVCSANLGNAPPDDLGKWLPADGHGADIIAVGVQEATWGQRLASGKARGPKVIVGRRRSTGDGGNGDSPALVMDDGEEDDDDDEDDEMGSLYVPAEDVAATGIDATDSMSQRLMDHLGACRATERIRVLRDRGVDVGCNGGGARSILRFTYGPGHPYVLLAVRRAGQMRLYVFCRPAVVEMVRDVETHSENTGVAGVLANKGGQLIKMRIRGSTFCFMSSHLRAHEGQSNAKQRNANVVEILNGCRVGQTSLDATNQFTHVFWVGDLNYRLSSHVRGGTEGAFLDAFKNESHRSFRRSGRSLQMQMSLDADADTDGDVDAAGTPTETAQARISETAAAGGDSKAFGLHRRSPSNLNKVSKAEREALRFRVLQLIDAGDFRAIYALDELQLFLREHVILCGFETPTPTFRPTFKTKRQAGCAYNEKRIPSYTDRVLYKSLPGMEKRVRVGFYRSHEDFASSDHKPISALFEVETVPTPLLHVAPRHDANMSVLCLDELRCTDLPVMDLDVGGVGGLADPYVKFYSNPPQLLRMQRARTVPGMRKFKRPRTATRMRTLEPRWEPQRIKLNVDYGEPLTGCHLMLHVMDYDLSFLNPDDPIGTALLDLEDLVAREDGVVFDLPLTWNSEFRGRIQGRAILRRRADEQGPRGLVDRQMSQFPASALGAQRRSSQGSRLGYLDHDDSAAYSINEDAQGGCCIA